MYDQILRGISEANSLTSPEALGDYLSSLKPFANQLFDSYRTQRIAVDYSDPRAQSCYLLRYFPIYVQPIKEILTALEATGETLFTPEQTILNALFIGPGPCPEVAGFVATAARYCKATTFQIHLRDKYAGAWQYSRDIVYHNILPPLSDQNTIALHPETADFTHETFVTDSLEQIRAADYIVFQHCLNETPFTKHSLLKSNLLNVIEEMKTGAILLVIERAGYADILNILAEVETQSKDKIKILRPIKAGLINYYGYAITSLMPKIITDNLLDGIPYQVENGRIPSTKVSYEHLVYRKMG